MSSPKSRAAARQAALPFLEALRASPPAVTQSRLLNTADRDLAAVLSVLEAAEREEVYAKVGKAKAARLADELVRMEHVRLPPETVETVALHLAEHISGDRPLGPASRYFKPTR